MSEEKFTKGEWVENGAFVSHVDLGCDAIVSGAGCKDISYKEAEANANLIARAPNLYHALKRTTEELAFVIDRYNKKVKDPANFIDAETCHLNQIELAKARGEKC